MRDPDRLKVLTVVSNLGIGGTERAAVNFAVAYSQIGMDSRVLCAAGEGPRALVLAQAQVPHYIGDGGIKTCSTWGPDLIHLHTNGLAEPWVRQLITSCQPCRVVEQNVFSRPSPWTDLVDVSFQLTPVCEQIYLRSSGGKASSPTAIVPNPVDTESFWSDSGQRRLFRARHGVPDDAVVLGRVGQPIMDKWSPLLVRSFNWLARERSDVWLLLVGAPDVILSQAHRSEYADRIVTLPGDQTDVQLRSIYSSMDVFLHAAAQGESFGYVLVEAMLCEVPVVTIRTPWADNSQGYVVGQLVGGLVADNPRSYREALQRLASDPALRASLGSSGRTRALAKFGWNEVAHQALSAASLISADGPNPLNWHGGVNQFEKSDQKSFGILGRLRSFIFPKVMYGAWRWLGIRTVDRARRTKRSLTFERSGD